MKDTRKERQALVIIFSAGVGAAVGQLYIAPMLEKRLKVRKP